MLITIIIASLLAFKTASAYIDPGVGSQIIQIIIGSLLAATYGIRMFIKKKLLKMKNAKKK